MKTFDVGAERAKSQLPNPIDIKFMWGDTPMVASPPTSGQVALFLANQAGTGGMNAGALKSMFDLLAAVLSQEHYDIIEEQLHEGIDLQLVVDLIEYLIEEWSTRPTTRANGSSRSRPSTGRASTVKPRSLVSTSGNSRSTAG